VPEDDAMEHCTRKPGDEKEIPAFGRDSIEQAMRQRIRETIEALVKEELDAALGAPKSARVGVIDLCRSGSLAEQVVPNLQEMRVGPKLTP
jgi:hypothetical protein